mgnify:CR=1 FL=1
MGYVYIYHYVLCMYVFISVIYICILSADTDTCFYLLERKAVDTTDKHTSWHTDGYD